MAYNTNPVENSESAETTQLLRQLQGKVKILQMENANLKRAGRLSASVPDLSAGCQKMVRMHIANIKQHHELSFFKPVHHIPLYYIANLW